jgi:tRNA 2-thiouridine synthesizing protein A
MALIAIDAKGLKCPQPTLKLTTSAATLKPGDVIEIVADCATFEADIKGWCQRMKKVLVFIRDEGNGNKKAQVQI